jgi:DNA repair exonuclease SbcCD ATPase subunit
MLEKDTGEWHDCSSSTAAATNKAILDAFGVPFEVFCLLSFVGQGFTETFSSLGDVGRKRFLETILGLSEYDAIQRATNERLRGERELLTKVQANLESSDRTLESLRGQVEEERESTEEAKANSAKILKTLEAQIEHTTRDLNEWKAKLVKVEEEKEPLERAQAAKLHAVEQERAALSGSESAKAALQEKCNSTDRQLVRAQDRLDTRAGEARSISDRCLACGQSLPDDALKRAKDSAWAQVRRASDDLKGINKERHQAHESLAVALQETQLHQEAVAQAEAELGGVHERLTSIEASRLEADRRVHTLEAKLLAAHREYGLEKLRDFEAALRRLETLLAEEEERREKLAGEVKVDEQNVRFLEFVASVFHPKGVRSYALDRGLKAVNEALGDICQSLFGGDFTLALSSTKGKKDGSESNVLDIVFSNAGGSYLSASGGERRKVDLALQLALSVLATRMSRGSTNLLVADEVLDTLDATASGFAVQALEAVAETGKRVFLISHDLAVQALVSNVLFVEKRGDVSSITETV